MNVVSGSVTYYAITAALLATGCFATHTLAIQPSQWVHTTEADFAQGQTDQTVVTNLGDVKLATGTQLVSEISEQAGIIHDLQVTGQGQIFLAVGPEGSLLVQKDGRVEQVVSLPEEQIFALDKMADGRLLVAVSAPDSRLAVLEGDQLKTLIQLEGVRYIWDILVDGEQVFLATGTEGKLLWLDLTQKADDGNPPIIELLDAEQNNLLCLGRDSLNRIYTGTDGDGLVYRLVIRENNAPEIFVLYDAPEPEIGAILVLGNGTVYAGTADADQARPGRLEEAATAESGRPERTEPTKQKGEPGQMPRVPPTPEPMLEPSLPQHAPSDTGEPQSSTWQKSMPVLATASPSWQQPQSSRALTGSASTSQPPDPTDGSEANQTNSEPTAAQRDRLRQVIRQRLEQARESGTLQVVRKSTLRSARRSLSGKKTGAKKGSTLHTSTKEGNAIYRISPDGFVTEIFRESVMILKLLQDPAGGGKLLVATGNEGQLFRVDPAAEETTILVDLAPQQVPAMVQNAEGQVLLGTANPASLVRLEAGYSDGGTYTSPVLDANQISLWGKINVSVTTPHDTRLAIESRSGNVQDPEQAAWSSWSPPQDLIAQSGAAPLTPRQTAVQCPPARFLQYRLTFSGDSESTPVVDRVQLAYLVPNLKPVISSIQTNYPHASTSSPKNGSSRGQEHAESDSVLELEWEATDPNSDRLLFKLEYQPAGATTWLLLAEDLEEQSFEWQTHRVPDGRYLIRITTSDHLDNPLAMAKTASRRADPVLIDNTAPTIGPLAHEVVDQDLRITGQVQDRLSSIRTVSYRVDSDDNWKPILPDDLIYDSTLETFTIIIVGIAQGPHIVTVRAADDRGNNRYEAALLEIP